mgnify:CR=1 FL=1
MIFVMQVGLNKKELNYEEAISLYLNLNEEKPILDYCFKIVVLLIILYFLYLKYGLRNI